MNRNDHYSSGDLSLMDVFISAWILIKYIISSYFFLIYNA